jgi:hypothetical protein
MAPILLHGRTTSGRAVSTKPPRTQPTRSSAIERAENAVTQRHC